MEVYIFNEKRLLHLNTKEIKYYINENGCFVCISHCFDPCGYPQITRDRKKFAMSRYIYTIYKGEIPEKYEVMHSCDNPNCINPDHLSIGTHKDNMDDRDRKGRQSDKHGFSNPKCKLSLEDIINIKSDNTSTHYELAEKFNVNRSIISGIKTGRYWSEIEVEGFQPVFKRKTPVKLTDDQIREIIQRKNEDKKKLANEYEVAPSTIWNIINRKVYTRVII